MTVAAVRDTVTVTERDSDPVLTPGQVADLFRVDPRTVVRWAKAGRIPSFRTPGGHHRFRTSAVRPYLPQQPEGAHDDDD